MQRYLLNRPMINKMKKYYIFQNNGFSLVELAVVTAIVGIMLSIAIPSIIASLPKRRVNQIARNVVADLQWIRMKAVNENVDTYYMSVDNLNKTFTLFNDNFVTNGVLDNNELIRVTDINNIHSSITFGTVAGVNDPAGGVVLFPNSVSLNYTSQGTITQPTYLYLRPNNDTTGEHLRAIQILRSGNIKVWVYKPSTAEWSN